MTAPRPLRLSPDAAVAELHGESVLLHLGTGRYYAVNGTGTTLLALLKEGTSREALAAALISTYAIERQAADADVARWLALLVGGGLVLETTPPAVSSR